MKKKTIKYKSGRITLYRKGTDEYFGGSLILKSTKKTQLKSSNQVRADILSKVLEENFSHNLDAIIQSLHIKSATPKELPIGLTSEEHDPGMTENKPKISETNSKTTDKKDKEPGLFHKDPPAKKPSASPAMSQNIFKEYWDLIDFPALFKYLFHTLSIVFTAISSNLEPITKKIIPVVERHFYTDNIKSETVIINQNNFLKIPDFSFKLPSKSLAIIFLIISMLSISSVLLPLAVAKINSINQQARAEETAAINQKLAEERAAQLKLFEYDPGKEESVPKEFKLFIPKIGLESDISPSVDLDNEEVYKQQLLNTGVAHGKGSYFPGQNGSVFLFAHSTDSVLNIAQFNAKFFSLGELQDGDEIDITYRGKQYKYKVSGRVIIDPSEVDLIRESGNSLILMTCTPPGTDWQRLIIFADEINSR